MTSLLAARRQHFAAALRLHANAEAVRLGAPAASRLKCALWQNSPPLLLAIGSTQSQSSLFHPQRQNSLLPSPAADSEFSSVFDPYAQGQEMRRTFRRGLLPAWRHGSLCQVKSISVQDLANLCRESHRREGLLQKPRPAAWRHAAAAKTISMNSMTPLASGEWKARATKWHPNATAARTKILREVGILSSDPGQEAMLGLEQSI
jgi:hypothetical protein